jgi:hypothetical protein
MASAEAKLIPIILAALLAAVPRAGAAQSSELRGRVLTDAGVPVAGATVTLTAIRYSVKTDSLGRFHLAGTPGSTLNLSLQASGFRDDTAAVVLPRGRHIEREFVLVSESTPIPEANPSDRVLRVRVTTTDGEPIAYANLQISGGRRYVSDDSGRVTAPITVTGPAALLARRIGFEPTEMKLAEMPDTTIRLQMKPVATTLAAQVITVRSPFVRLDLGGFYRRMAEVQNGARIGYFMTPEDLALRRAQNVTDAVEHFPNIRLAPIDDGQRGTDGLFHADGTPQRRRFRIEDRNGCPLTVYLDRMRVQPVVIGLKAMDEEINSIIQIQTVAGIEVYPRAAGAPPEYPAVNSMSIGECGVVLIWTK